MTEPKIFQNMSTFPFTQYIILSAVINITAHSTIVVAWAKCQVFHYSKTHFLAAVIVSKTVLPWNRSKTLPNNILQLPKRATLGSSLMSLCSALLSCRCTNIQQLFNCSHPHDIWIRAASSLLHLGHLKDTMRYDLCNLEGE